MRKLTDKNLEKIEKSKYRASVYFNKIMSILEGPNSNIGILIHYNAGGISSSILYNSDKYLLRMYLSEYLDLTKCKKRIIVQGELRKVENLNAKNRVIFE